MTTNILKEIKYSEIYIDMDEYIAKKHVVFKDIILEAFLKVEEYYYKHDDDNNIILWKDIFDTILNYKQKEINTIYTQVHAFIETYLEEHKDYFFDEKDDIVYHEFYIDWFYALKSDSKEKRYNNTSHLTITNNNDQEISIILRKPIEIYQEMWFSI